MKRWPTRLCFPWSASSITPSHSETVSRSYTAPMRSRSCRSRIHIRPGRYWARESSSLPSNDTHPNIRTRKNTATEGRWLRERALLISRRNTNVKLVEPPSCSATSTLVFIGQNSRGNWVAQEQNGLYGGLFVHRAQAVKYALFENGHHPQTIIELPLIELHIARHLPLPARG